MDTLAARLSNPRKELHTVRDDYYCRRESPKGWGDVPAPSTGWGDVPAPNKQNTFTIQQFNRNNVQREGNYLVSSRNKGWGDVPAPSTCWGDVPAPKSTTSIEKEQESRRVNTLTNLAKLKTKNKSYPTMANAVQLS